MSRSFVEVDFGYLDQNDIGTEANLIRMSETKLSEFIRTETFHPTVTGNDTCVFAADAEVLDGNRCGTPIVSPRIHARIDDSPRIQARINNNPRIHAAVDNSPRIHATVNNSPRIQAAVDNSPRVHATIELGHVHANNALRIPACTLTQQ